MKRSAKNSARDLRQKKSRRRQGLTFVRIIKYGVNNLTRNAWLTIAATAVMTITLLTMFMTVVAQDVLKNLVQDVNEKVKMSLYLDTNVTYDQALPIIEEIKALDNVKDVTFTSSVEAKQKLIEKEKHNLKTLDALQNAKNRLPATVSVSLYDINNTEKLREYTDSSSLFGQYKHPSHEPSFKGEKKGAIEEISSWTRIAGQIGFASSIVFMAISSLIIFNTIRMAIFSRKDEIYMMKLIGASKRFIRGPFIVESVIYGVVAAIIAVILGTGTLYLLNSDKLLAFGIDLTKTLDVLIAYIVPVTLAMMLVGSVIGVLSALVATRRYLKL